MNTYHIENQVPNQEPRPAGQVIDTIVIHSTRGGTADDATELSATINWFKNPGSQASSHLVIAASGDIWYCVDPAQKAYHAKDLNSRSIGIELVQRTPDQNFTPEQYKSLAEAVNWYCQQYAIPKVLHRIPGIIGHEETGVGQEDGKTDPGFHFVWTILGRDIGITPPVDPKDAIIAARDAEIAALKVKIAKAKADLG